MQLAEAESIALDLMREHGLEDWQFSFDRARRRLGACWLHRRRITLSREFVRLNDEDLVRDVILHEIAHALTPGEGHGAVFKRKARELGCSASSCISDSRMVAASPSVILECPHCGRSWQRYRRPTRKLACAACLSTSSARIEPLRVKPA